MRKKIPVALTIAGSDSGGGAGIQADLKTFASLGVHGTSAITCVTAQNPKRVSQVQPCSPKIVRAQMESVFSELHPAVAKTGMLFSATIVREVADFFKRENKIPLVVDPVMIATSGRSLLDNEGIRILQGELLPRATLVTPNLPEAEVLLGNRIRTVEDLRASAKSIHKKFGCAALVKGGHLRGVREAIDFFYDGKSELMLSAPRIKKIRTHGTGCTYSAAITAYLARGFDLASAVQLAKEYITQAIAQSLNASGHAVLKHGARSADGSSARGPMI